jgi:RNA polymerase sigma-70 factor (ECF subfamily)
LEETEHDFAGAVAEDPASRASAEQALAAIASLPEAYRETLLLRFVAGLTGPEIAQRTGLTHGSVRVNLHRGVALLRQRLEGGGERA